MKLEPNVSPSSRTNFSAVPSIGYTLVVFLLLISSFACSAKPSHSTSSTSTPTPTHSTNNNKVAGTTDITTTTITTSTSNWLIAPFFAPMEAQSKSSTTTTSVITTTQKIQGIPLPQFSPIFPRPNPSTTSSTTTSVHKPTPTEAPSSTTAKSSKSKETTKTSDSKTNSPPQVPQVTSTESSSTTTTVTDDPMVSVQMVEPSTTVAGTQTITIGIPPQITNPTAPHGELNDPSSPTVIVLVPPSSQNEDIEPPTQIIVLLKGDKGVVANAASVLVVRLDTLLLAGVFLSVFM